MEEIIQQQITEILETQKRTEILLRVNNLLLSKFILQLSKTREDLHLPKRQSFFRFELLDDEYKELVQEFGVQNVNKALYKLDRMLLQNKLNCPHNIKKYISKRLRKGEENNDRKK